MNNVSYFGWLGLAPKSYLITVNCDWKGDAITSQVVWCGASWLRIPRIINNPFSPIRKVSVFLIWTVWLQAS